MLRGKPRGTTNWLPSQVAYGIDTSDENPEKWAHFGDMAEQMELKKHAPVDRKGAAAEQR